MSALCVGFKKEKTSQKFTSNLTKITFYIFLVAVAIFFKSCLKIHRKNIFFFSVYYVLKIRKYSIQLLKHSVKVFLSSMVTELPTNRGFTIFSFTVIGKAAAFHCTVCVSVQPLVSIMHLKAFIFCKIGG